MCVATRPRSWRAASSTCTIDGHSGVSRRRRANDRRIVKSTSPRQRDTRSGKWRSIIIRACSSERYVNPDLVPFSCELHKNDVYLWNRPQVHIRIHVHTRPLEGRVYTRTNCCTSTRTRAPRVHIKGRIYRFSSHD